MAQDDAGGAAAVPEPTQTRRPPGCIVADVLLRQIGGPVDLVVNGETHRLLQSGGVHAHLRGGAAFPILVRRRKVGVQSSSLG